MHLQHNSNGGGSPLTKKPKQIMTTLNLVTLQSVNQDTQEMYWQTKKHAFVLYEDWDMELHDAQDFKNACETAEENNYMGIVTFEHSEITAFELSQTNS